MDPVEMISKESAYQGFMDAIVFYMGADSSMLSIPEQSDPTPNMAAERQEAKMFAIHVLEMMKNVLAQRSE